MFLKAFLLNSLMIAFSLSCISQEKNSADGGLGNYKVELSGGFVDTISNKLIEYLLVELNKKSKLKINRSDLCVKNRLIDTIDYMLVRSENIRYNLYNTSETAVNLISVDSIERENLNREKSMVRFNYLDSYYLIGHKNEFNLLVSNSSNCKFEVHIEKYYAQENFLHTHVRLFPVPNESSWKDLELGDVWFIIENWKTIPNYLIGTHDFLIENGY